MADPRTVPPPNVQIVVEEILDWVITQLSNALYTPTDLLSDDNPKLFDFVMRGILEDINQNETPGVAVEQGEDEVVEGGPISYTRRIMRMYVHFKVISVYGIDQTDLINYYFGRITQVLVNPLDDYHDVGAIDIREVGNSIVANGINDPEPGGTIYFDIMYQYFEGNPFAEDY